MSIKFIDQNGKDIPLAIKQNGEPVGWVPQGRRTRFNIRFDATALRISRIEIPKDPGHWMVNEIAVHGASQIGKPWQAFSERPEDDGIPGEVLDAAGELEFATAQTAMVITFDVTYTGPNPEGQPLSMVVGCKAAY